MSRRNLWPLVNPLRIATKGNSAKENIFELWVQERKTFTGKVQRKLVGSAQSLFPFMVPEKLVAHGCTGGGIGSICNDDME